MKHLTLFCLLGFLGILGCKPRLSNKKNTLATSQVKVDLPTTPSTFDLMYARLSQSDSSKTKTFASLVRGFEQLSQTEVVYTIIPTGRSLQRFDAYPTYSQTPRIVATFIAPKKQPAGRWFNLQNRIFLGYTDATHKMEVISYNEQSGQFEFQVVKGLGSTDFPEIFYSDRHFCSNCHQQQSPLFPFFPWSETIADPRMRQYVEKAHPEGSYLGFNLKEVNAQLFDNLVRESDDLRLLDHAWNRICGAAVNLEKVALCRSRLIQRAVLLLGEIGIPNKFYDNFSTVLGQIIENKTNPSFAFSTGLIDRDPTTNKPVTGSKHAPLITEITENNLLQSASFLPTDLNPATLRGVSQSEFTAVAQEYNELRHTLERLFTLPLRRAPEAQYPNEIALTQPLQISLAANGISSAQGAIAGGAQFSCQAKTQCSTDTACQLLFSDECKISTGTLLFAVDVGRFPAPARQSTFTFKGPPEHKVEMDCTVIAANEKTRFLYCFSYKIAQMLSRIESMATNPLAASPLNAAHPQVQTILAAITGASASQWAGSDLTDDNALQAFIPKPRFEPTDSLSPALIKDPNLLSLFTLCGRCHQDKENKLAPGFFSGKDESVLRSNLVACRTRIVSRISEATMPPPNSKERDSFAELADNGKKEQLIKYLAALDEVASKNLCVHQMGDP